MTSAAEQLAPALSMKLSIDRAVLLKALSRIQGIVEKRNTIPILANVKIEANQGDITLTATDMDLSASETIEASVETTGALTVPAVTLYDIIRKLPEGSQVSLEGDASSSQLIVLGGSARFALSFLPAEEFPTMSEDQLTHRFKLPVSQILGLVDKAKFAMSTEETRYYLNGVFLHVSGEGDEARLKAVATDGHRLARIEAPVPEGAEGMPGVIIPRKAVSELKKIAEDAGDDVEVALSEAKMVFTFGGRKLLTKLIDGTFPDYERVIPKENDKILIADTKAFTQAVDRVSTISTDKTRGIKLALSSGKLTLLAQSTESGNAKEEMDVKYDADGMEIGFNARYMLDMLSELEGDEAQFQLSDSASPVLVRDPSDVGALFVIMPMRV